MSNSANTFHGKLRITVAGMIVLVLGLASTWILASRQAGPKESPGTASPGGVYVLPFEGGKGRVVVIREEQFVQFVVWVTGLEPYVEYEIGLETLPRGGVLFGTGNAYLNYGKMKNDTAVTSNSGRILMWSMHPERILTGADQAWVVVKEATREFKEVTRSQSFSLKTKSLRNNASGGMTVSTGARVTAGFATGVSNSKVMGD